MDPSTSVGRTPPVQRVPSEILSDIFIHCLPPPETEPFPRVQDAPLLLGRVNHYWRAVANSHPQLWTVIHIHAEPEYPKVNTSALSTWLQRSGSAPLQVTITDDTEGHPLWNVNDALSLLAPHACRWQSLDCDLDNADAKRLFEACARFGGFPLLKQLVLNCLPPRSRGVNPNPPSLGLSLLPKLVRVCFTSGGGFTWCKHDPPYALEEVVGNFSGSLMDCFHLIQNSPSLGLFKAECDQLSRFYIPAAPFTHHTLSDLTLTSYWSDQGFSQFLDSVTLPSLTTFRLMVARGNMELDPWSDSLARFLQRSSPPLERLYLHTFNDIQQIRCLRLVPTLRELHNPLITTLGLLETLTCRAAPSNPQKDTDVVPYLEEMTLFCTDFITPTELASMILSRWGGPTGRFPSKGRLRNIHIHLCEFQGEQDDLTTPELAQCIQEGLQVTWHEDEEDERMWEDYE